MSISVISKINWAMCLFQLFCYRMIYISLFFNSKFFGLQNIGGGGAIAPPPFSYSHAKSYCTRPFVGVVLCWDYSSETIGLCAIERQDVLWNFPVRPSVHLSVHPSTIAFERDILKAAYLIYFLFWYGLDTIKNSDPIDLGHSTKIKMAATAVWRLILYPIQDIACECGSLKIAWRIDFIFDIADDIDLGHSTKIKMAATAVWRLTMYPIHDIACERGSLKTAFRIDFTFWYGLDTTKTSDAFDLGQPTKIKMAATAVWRLTLYPMQDIACECGRLKTACQIDFTFWYGLCTSYTSNIIDLGHSMKIKMASIAVRRLTLYPMHDITS